MRRDRVSINGETLSGEFETETKFHDQATHFVMVDIM